MEVAGSFPFSPGRRSSGRGYGAQSGSSLLEVLVALVLVGILVPVVARGVLTVGRVGASNGGRSAAEAVASGVAERMPRLAYRACGTAAQLNDAYRTAADRYLPPRTTLEIVRVEYWSGSSNAFQPACEVVGGSSVDGGLQRVTIRATAEGASALAQFVLRDPNARPQ